MTADEPSPAPNRPHLAAFTAAAEKIRPAVVVLASFDEEGRLVANQQAFFSSANGDLVAERSAMNNAASAMVKGADGRAYDISGTYLRSAAPSFILLKTSARDVPHLDLAAAAEVPENSYAAVVLSAVGEAQPAFFVGQITHRKNEKAGEWLTIDPAPPKTSLGAPVIDERGAIIGIVAQREEGNAPAIFRSAGGKNTQIVETETSAPPEPSPPETAAAETPAEPAAPSQGPEVAEASPSPTDVPAKVLGHRGKIVYAPTPHYPKRLAWTRWNMRSSGSYRLTFNAQGEASDVQVTRPAGHPMMDQAAIETLRSWRCEPGQPWSVLVPITFKQ